MSQDSQGGTWEYLKGLIVYFLKRVYNQNQTSGYT